MKTNQLKRFFRMAAVALPAVAMSFVAACSESNDDGGDKPVKLSPETEQEQSVFADDKEAPAPIRFTATAPWTATVAEVQTKAEAMAVTRAEGGSEVDWLELSAYEGGSGDFSLTMTLKVNATGQDRKAEIRIVCGGMTLTITVEQKKTKADGTKPEPTPEEPNKPDASNLKYRIMKIEYEESWYGGSTTTGVYTFTYDNSGRLTEQKEVRKRVSESASESGTSVYTTTITYGKGTVSYEYTDYDDGVLDVQCKSTAVLNKNGWIDSGDMVGSERYEGMDSEFVTKYSLDYDEEGYLVQSSVIEPGTGNSIDETSPDIYHTTWTDGNPTRVEWELEYDGVKKNIEYAAYGTIPNNTNLDLNRLLLLDTEGWAFSVGDERGILAAMGYTGKRSKNLAENIRWKHAWNDSVRAENYTYQFDEESRVVGITRTYTYSDETAKYTIHYAK